MAQDVKTVQIWDIWSYWTLHRDALLAVSKKMWRMAEFIHQTCCKRKNTIVYYQNPSLIPNRGAEAHKGAMSNSLIFIPNKPA